MTVTELSKHHKISSRQIRRIIAKLFPETTEQLIFKDYNNIWNVHHLLINRFKPKRIRRKKYYALTIDPVHDYTANDIHEIMAFVFKQMNDEGFEINYTIETKKSSGRNHIHCYVKCKNKKKLIELIRLGFSSVSYNDAVIYDLEGWKEYITKQYNNITTLKN